MLNNRKDITKNGYLEDTTEIKHSSKRKNSEYEKKKKVKKFQHLPNRNSKKEE